MLLYYLKCRKNSNSKNPIVTKTNQVKLMILSKFALSGSKKSRSIN